MRSGILKSKAALKIVQVGDPVLRQKARALTASEISSAEIQNLIARMRETLHKAPGVGLAAPQVGFPLQLAVIEDREEYQDDVDEDALSERERGVVPFHVIINPVLKLDARKSIEFNEGCLSLSGFMALVPRARSVRVECLDERGRHRVIQASGWYARILQHECDHLQGTLYIDRMRSRSFTSMENWDCFWKEKSIEDVRSAFS
jgi:peptide deformylase